MEQKPNHPAIQAFGARPGNRRRVDSAPHFQSLRRNSSGLRQYSGLRLLIIQTVQQFNQDQQNWRTG
jgi:hypothetical protein